ncbi:MAG TPA: hypothetical protein VNI84_18230 [Pyrinomonadaceae bacterium]|nr:hypothetical protein [Pyrinomonadaceae bacterium]
MIDQPDFLKLSPEKLAENQQRDESLRRKFNSRLKLSPFEQERARALVMEDEQRETVNKLNDTVALARKVARDGLTEVAGIDVDRALLRRADEKRVLAEMLAAQGKFLDAARQTTIPVERELYRKTAEAIARDDNDLCDCPAPTGGVAGQILVLPKYRIVRQVYSLSAAAEVSLLECIVCGEWNARDLTPDLVKQQRAVANTTEENKISDLELLKENK